MKTMHDCGQFESSDALIAACLPLDDAARKAFDAMTVHDGGTRHAVCCGEPVTSTSFIGSTVRARCLKCGNEIVDVTWPMGPLLYDPATPQCAYMPSRELYERVGDRCWLVVRWSEQGATAALEGR